VLCGGNVLSCNLLSREVTVLSSGVLVELSRVMFREGKVISSNVMVGSGLVASG
jgi:hypothetical protein